MADRLLMQPFNVLRYQLGQHYDSHYDVFEPESYGPQTSQRVRPLNDAMHAYAASSGLLSIELSCKAISSDCAYLVIRCISVCLRVSFRCIFVQAVRSHAPIWLLLTVQWTWLQMATVLFYLTDVEEGGETIFPLEGKDGLQRLNHIDYRKCDMGLKVRSLTEPPAAG